MAIQRRQITTRGEWLSWRRNFLCASEIAAAAGYDEYRSALSIYAEKLGLVTQAETSIMRRGRHFEKAAISFLSEERPNWRIERPNVFLFDDDWRLACTPDALAEIPGTPGIVNCQVKTISRTVFDKWDGYAPTGYTLQVACENMLLDATHGLLVVLVVSTHDAELVTFDVPRHAKAEEKIREIAQTFWKNIEAGEMPAADYRRDAEVIAALYPKGDPALALDLSGDNRLAEILPARKALKARIKADEEQVAAYDAEIRAKLGPAERATLPGWKISLKEQHRAEYVIPAKSFRVLRVTGSGISGDNDDGDETAA